VVLYKEVSVPVPVRCWKLISQNLIDKAIDQWHRICTGHSWSLRSAFWASLGLRLTSYSITYISCYSAATWLTALNYER